MWVPCHFLQIPWIYAVTQRPHNGPYKVQIIPRLANTMKVKIFNLPQLCQLLPSFHYKYSESQFAYVSYLQGYPWHFSNECHSAFEALKKAFTTAWSLPSDPGHSIQWGLNLWLCTCCCPFHTTPDVTCTKLHSTPGLFSAWTQYDVHNQKYSQFLKLSNNATLLEGSDSINKVLITRICKYFSNDQNPQHQQAHWLNTFQINLVICFCPGKLRTNWCTH